MSLAQSLVILAGVVNTIDRLLTLSADLLQSLVIFLTEKLPTEDEVVTSEKTLTLGTLKRSIKNLEMSRSSAPSYIC